MKPHSIYSYEDSDFRTRPLFVRGLEMDSLGDTTNNPSHQAERREFLSTILRAARLVGRLHIRVFHIYRRYEHETGTSHGAYIHIARLAVLFNGEVRSIRPWRTSPNLDIKPVESVVRQVRKIHLQACKRIRVVAQQLGFSVPSGF